MDRRHAFMRLALASALAVTAHVARGQPSAGDGLATPTTRGAVLFRSDCGFCHGADARGAQGPNLTASGYFKLEDNGASLAQFLKTGRPTAGMPPFPALTPSEAAAIHAFVRAQAGGGPTQAAMNPMSILVGDAAAGRSYFEGAGGCTSCHSAAGDLKDVGRRYDPVTLQGRILNPRLVGAGRPGVRTPAPPRVKVSLADGRVVEGALVQVSDFFVTLVDAMGVRRTIPRDNDRPRVEVRDPVEAHRQMMPRWTDRNLHDVTAYLAGLK